MNNIIYRNKYNEKKYANEVSYKTNLDVRVLTGIVIGQLNEVHREIGNDLPMNSYLDLLFNRLVNRNISLYMGCQVLSNCCDEDAESNYVLINDSLYVTFRSYVSNEIDLTKIIRKKIKSEGYEMGLLINFDNINHNHGVIRIVNDLNWH